MNSTYPDPPGIQLCRLNHIFFKVTRSSYAGLTVRHRHKYHTLIANLRTERQVHHPSSCSVNISDHDLCQVS